MGARCGTIELGATHYPMHERDGSASCRRADPADPEAAMTEPVSGTPDATRGTVSLADEEGVKRILVEHHAHWLSDRDRLGTATTARDGA
jgi:hypothetical protein